MTNGTRQRTRAVALATLMIAGFASTAMAVDPGVGVGAPGVGAVDPGLNQPGVAGNVGGVARRSVRR
jgi:hypothetical protein